MNKILLLLPTYKEKNILKIYYKIKALKINFIYSL